MKNYKQTVKMLAVVLIALSCFFLPDVKAQNRDTKLLIGKPITFYTDMHFGDSKASFNINWREGKVKITYEDSTRVDDAAKAFFEYLQKYIESEYYILKKSDYEFTDGWKFELYFKEKGKK